jgi:hypothetical protein
MIRFLTASSLPGMCTLMSIAFLLHRDWWSPLLLRLLMVPDVDPLQVRRLQCPRARTRALPRRSPPRP